MNEAALVEQAPEIELYRTAMVPLEWLREADYNPNELKSDEEFRALKVSITENKEFFQARPILANKAPGREGVIVGGAKRFLAAKEMGWEKVPVMFVYAETVEKEKAWNLLDNNHNGQLNEMKRQQIFLELHSMGYDLTSLGHTPNEVNDIMGGFNLSEKKEGPGSIPAKGWLECPQCNHQAPKKEFKRIDPVEPKPLN